MKKAIVIVVLFTLFCLVPPAKAQENGCWGPSKTLAELIARGVVSNGEGVFMLTYKTAAPFDGMLAESTLRALGFQQIPGETKIPGGVETQWQNLTGWQNPCPPPPAAPARNADLNDQPSRLQKILDGGPKFSFGVVAAIAILALVLVFIGVAGLRLSFG